MKKLQIVLFSTALSAAIVSGQQATPQPQALPPCEAPAPPKKPSMFDRIKQRAAQRLAITVANAEGKAGAAISKGSKGNIDGTVLPNAQDIAGAMPKPKPCAPAASAVPVGQSK